MSYTVVSIGANEDSKKEFKTAKTAMNYADKQEDNGCKIAVYHEKEDGTVQRIR